MRRPILGSEQANVRWDGLPPRPRTRSLWCWRAFDGELAPLNEGMSVQYLGRSAPATIYDSAGVSGSLATAMPAFSSEDWNGDGVREEDILLMSDEEALRFLDATTGRLVWDTGPKVIRIDGIELGNALVEDAPYWSFTKNDGAGAYLALLGAGDLGSGVGGISIHHYNGTSTVVSTLPLPAAARFSARANFHANGAVQLGLVVNGGAELQGTKSAALTPAETWGNDGATVCRVNEFGNTVRGAFGFRYGAVFGGNATRRELLEAL